MNNLPICLVIGVDSKNPEDVIKGTYGALALVYIVLRAYVSNFFLANTHCQKTHKSTCGFLL